MKLLREFGMFVRAHPAWWILPTLFWLAVIVGFAWWDVTHGIS